MRKTVQAERIVVAKATLLGLYEQYGYKREFSMDRYHRLEKLLDEIYAHEIGIINKKIYPNPCAEILLGTMETD